MLQLYCRLNVTKPRQAFMTELPDFYETVAEEILCKCHPREGVWLDLGAGAGGVGLALARRSTSTIVLVDPDSSSLRKASGLARESGLGRRVVTMAARAEAIPLPADCVDLVVSRGSIFFWKDRAQGLREVHRILRPGGAAMIGGGLGRSYPEWARRKFIRQRREGVKKGGPDAVRRFKEARSSRTFHKWAAEAGLTHFEVAGDGGYDPDSSQAGLGIWLWFRKAGKGV